MQIRRPFHDRADLSTIGVKIPHAEIQKTPDEKKEEERVCHKEQADADAFQNRTQLDPKQAPLIKLLKLFFRARKDLTACARKKYSSARFIIIAELLGTFAALARQMNEGSVSDGEDIFATLTPGEPAAERSDPE